MSNYLKYAVLSTMRLTQLDETINQLNTIKYPTKQLKELIKHLEWIREDYEPMIKLLNQESLFDKKYNCNNLQLRIDFC